MSLLLLVILFISSRTMLDVDIIFDIDFNHIVDYHKKKGVLVIVFTNPNRHPYDSGLILDEENDAIVK